MNGNLFLTVSLRINSDKTILNKSIAEKFTLDNAIAPFFQDITDTGRHFLHKNNPERIVDPTNPITEGVFTRIIIPPSLMWKSEGDSLRVDFESSIVLAAYFRSFWFRHIDGNFTFNCSFQIEYSHSVEQYFAIAALQKSIFPNQEILQVDDNTDNIYINEPGNSIWSFIGDNFEKECDALFGARSSQEINSWKEIFGITINGPIRENLLVRATCIFQDDFFFKLIHRSSQSKSSGEIPISENVHHYSRNEIISLEKNLEQLSKYFLSGFVHNVFDFLRQSSSEVVDGLNFHYPILKSVNVSDQENFLTNNDQILYINDSCIYQFVSESRSLRSASKYIGTCPYLFYVHMMTLHDEALIVDYERIIKKILYKLDELGWTSEKWKSLSTNIEQMNQIIESFDHARIRIFERIDKYRHMNILSYETERSFYLSIRKIRGFDERHMYWEQLINRLEAKISDVREKIKSESSEVLEKVLFVLAFLGISEGLKTASEDWRHVFFENEGLNRLHIVDYALSLNSMALTFCILIAFIFFSGSKWKSFSKKTRNTILVLFLTLSLINVVINLITH
jgi:hypothetical protein